MSKWVKIFAAIVIGGSSIALVAASPSEGSSGDGFVASAEAQAQPAEEANPSLSDYLERSYDAIAKRQAAPNALSVTVADTGNFVFTEDHVGDRAQNQAEKTPIAPRSKIGLTTRERIALRLLEQGQ